MYLILIKQYQNVLVSMSYFIGNNLSTDCLVKLSLYSVVEQVAEDHINFSVMAEVIALSAKHSVIHADDSC